MELDTECPVCSSRQTQEFLRQTGVPVHQNLLFSTGDSARAMPRGALAMRCCIDCGFVFNGDFEPNLLSYDAHYDNTQTFSPAFVGHVDGLVKHLVEERGVRDSTVVEVGCGKGGFLRRLVMYPGCNNKGLGFDPTYEGPDHDLEGRLEFHRCFYDEQCAKYQADAVICRHVIEHVEHPLVLLRAVRKALEQSPQASVFFETPCVEWILRNQVMWDFFYEHCSLFTENSIKTAFRQSGFEVVSVRHVFEGQYLWLEAQPAASDSLVNSSDSEVKASTIAAALAYKQARCEQVRTWTERLTKLREQGQIALWGAGAKGVTFANLCDSQAQIVDYVIDVNPNKQGRYLAGTGHPIIGPDEIPSGLAAVLVLNPNYLAEVRASLDKYGHSCPVVNLMQWDAQVDLAQSGFRIERGITI